MRLLGIALATFSAVSFAQAADLPTRKGAPVAPVVTASCLENEKTFVPVDAFGFSASSDVADLGAWGAALEYNGGFGARGGVGSNFNSHLAKLQVSGSFIRCLEVGPYVYGSWSRYSNALASGRTDALGGGIELKYKLFGRATHGFGLTFVIDPTVAGVETRFTDKTIPLTIKTRDTTYGVSFKVLLDKQLTSNLFGAINLALTPTWVDGVNGVATTEMAASTALAYQLNDSFFLGAELQYKQLRAGWVDQALLGQAVYLGPTFYWQASKQVSLSGTVAANLLDKRTTNGAYADVIGKVKLGYAF
jgi:hypothetical protein